MGHPSGFWLGSAAPRLEGNASRNNWQTFLSIQLKRLTDGRNVDDLVDDTQKRAHRSEYPERKPLADVEQKARRRRRPKSPADRRFFRMGFPSHSGCRRPLDARIRRNRATIKTMGARPLIQMQLARRGGHLDGGRIEPEDGPIQPLRRHLLEKEV